MSKLDLSGHLFRTAAHFARFADSLPAFANLGAWDKHTLLRRNTALFVTYIFAR
jgi:hypothetical protein